VDFAAAMISDYWMEQGIDYERVNKKNTGRQSFTMADQRPVSLFKKTKLFSL
jgi:hypothetical protein